MVTITLTPELEQAVTERARQQGTTPELLTLDKLREIFVPVVGSPPIPGETLADFLGDFIGSIHSSENTPGGAQMSTDSGKKFASGMLKKRQDGKL